MILDLCGGEASEVVTAGAVPDTDRAYRLDTDRVQSPRRHGDPGRRTARARSPRWASAGRRHGACPVLAARRAGRGRPGGRGRARRLAHQARRQADAARATAGVPKPVLTPMQKREQMARRTMAALGYNECVTYSFIDQASARCFRRRRRRDDAGKPDLVRDEPHAPRPAAGAVAGRGPQPGAGLHGSGAVRGRPRLPRRRAGGEHLQVAGLLVGAPGPRTRAWGAPPGRCLDAKADAEAVLPPSARRPRCRSCAARPPGGTRAGHGRICLGPKKVLGVFGELHPRCCRDGREGPGRGLHPLARGALPRKGGATRPRWRSDLQPVERDFAFVVDADVEALTLVNAAPGPTRR
jgi:phenylalanyl-tRNA synthetase beta chain